MRDKDGWKACICLVYKLVHASGTALLLLYTVNKLTGQEHHPLLFSFCVAERDQKLAAAA